MSGDALLWSRLWLDAGDPALTERLAQHARTRRLADGEVLYAKGDPGTGLVGVKSGLIRNVRLTADGRELLFGLFGPGSWFGEISLFDTAPRPSHAIASGETEVLLLPASVFHATLAEHPEGYRHFARVLCHKLRVAFEAIEDNARPLGQRLARRLLDLAAVYGAESATGTRLTLPLPQEDLARMLGATRQSINRELRLLADAGAIAVEARRLTITDPAALKRAA